MSLDCERNGLRGEFLSIAVCFTEETGRNNLSEVVWAVNPDNIENINPWVKENVLPFHPEITNESEQQMLQEFSDFWKKKSQEYEITLVGHMIAPVETDLFSELYKLGLIGEFQGPYKFYDINILLDIVTGKHDSLDAYVQSKGLHFQSHNPLEDAKCTLFGYKYLLQDVDSSFSML